MSTEFSLLGAGGHGKVVLDAMMASGASVRVFDQNPGASGLHLLGCPVSHLADMGQLPGAPVHIAVGDNDARGHIADQLRDTGHRLATVRHPEASVSGHAAVGAGCFLAARSVTGPDARLGCAVIVNHGAVVDHDCNIGDFCHIAPNATLGGGVSLGDRVLVGSGAVLLPGVCVGRGATIGAGAVVTSTVAAGDVVMGIPARPSK